MRVDPARAAGQVEHNGTMYHFCGKACVAKFTADPDRYISGHREPMIAVKPIALTSRKAAPVQRPPQATRYTCPMHPEVISDTAGACPKCGMALEPLVTSSADISNEPNPELVDMTRRLRVG